MSRSLALVASVLIVATGGAQTPAPECRVFSADEVRIVTGATAGTVNQVCRFDLPATSRICTIRTRMANTNFDLELTDKYRSAADFVDEIRVIPPISRIQTQSRRYSSGPSTGGELRYEYDSNRRQTSIVSNMGGIRQVTTYGGWDVKGRPTTATVSGGTPFTLQYKYDDVQRTMTTTGPGGSQVDTYDANGNMIREEAVDGHGRTVFSIKINKTDKICKN